MAESTLFTEGTVIKNKKEDQLRSSFLFKVSFAIICFRLR